ncbi:hypothetical protein Taro_050973 [Colocasia esculenta]|uniref:Uncharacterized protein n=1 Tax=Colocasia esculenta TaxID=4460 RepID=A0A843XES3_COLES|nr:hypothetical protein [Colocasia esculenta]
MLLFLLLSSPFSPSPWWGSSLPPSQVFGHDGGAGVLVAEHWSGVERGGGGHSDVKGPNGSSSSISYEERDGSIRRVHHLKATPCLSPSGCDSVVTFSLLSVFLVFGLSKGGMLWVWALGQSFPRALSSDEERDGSIPFSIIPSSWLRCVCLCWPTVLLGVPRGVSCVSCAYWTCLGYEPAMSFACCGCPAYSQFTRCSALEGLSRLDVVYRCLGPPVPMLVEVVLQAAGVLE